MNNPLDFKVSPLVVKAVLTGQLTRANSGDRSSIPSIARVDERFRYFGMCLPNGTRQFLVLELVVHSHLVWG